MLPRSNRIPRAEFKPLLESRNYLNSEFFTLRYVLTPGGRVRVAVSVAKKVAKLAVDRNSTRRRVYATLHPILGELKGGSYLIIAKKGAEKLRGENLKAEINKIFQTKH